MEAKACEHCGNPFVTDIPDKTVCDRQICRNTRAVIELDEQGWTENRIMQALGLSRSVLQAIFRKKGIVQKHYKQGFARKHKRDPRLTDMKRRYERGESFADIGKAYGLTRERVRQIMLQADIYASDRRRAKKEERIATIKAFCEHGLTTQQIAERLGVARSTAASYLHRSGLKATPEQRAKHSIEEVIAIYRETRSTVQTAILLGTTSSNIWSRLRRAGVKMGERFGRKPQPVRNGSREAATLYVGGM